MLPLAAVLGHPIAHSLSPTVHNYWLANHGLKGQYCAIDAAPKLFGYTLEALPRLGFIGVNVTLPLKENALSLSDHATPVAQKLGASNMLTFTPGGVVADNTDAYGFTWNIRQRFPDWRPKTAAVLGAGGAARAVVTALKSCGATRILVSNRTAERARKMVEDLEQNMEIVPWSEREEMLAGCDTLINATSLGMTGKQPLELRLEKLPRTALVNDIVYVPLETPLLAAARARGNRVVDGLGMLLHQAVPAFEAWFRVRPQVDEGLRKAVLGR